MEYNITFNEKRLLELDKEISDLTEHKQNLENILGKITVSRAFAWWQALVLFKKGLLSLITNPNNIFLFPKAIRILIVEGPKSLISKVVVKKNSHARSSSINQQYGEWFKNNYPSRKILKKQKGAIQNFKYKPKISLILPTYNSDVNHLKECINSVLKQSYGNWQLCIADDASNKPEVKELISSFALQDERVVYTFRKTNGHICKASNTALNMCTGKYIGLLDHDDVLWPNALYEIALRLNKNKKLDLIYSDEDKLNSNGVHVDPFFKSDWNPDLLLSMNYITHFTVIRKRVITAIGGFRNGYEGAQDYDLFLRVARMTQRVEHISTILYSWRKTAISSASAKAALTEKSYAFDNQRKAIMDHLKKSGISAVVEKGDFLGLWRVKYKIGNPLISIIIPTRNKYDLINKCLESVFDKSTYSNFEVIVVDTGSNDTRVSKLYEQYEEKHGFKVVKWDKEFNFSSVCSYGAEKSLGEYLLFLNNDTEVIEPDWMQSMLEHAQREDVGAVGAKLLYTDGKIQHSGIILGIRGGEVDKGIAGHAFKYFDNVDQGAYLQQMHVVRNYSAVTAACMLINRNKFNEVNGFDDRFRIAFNDVDLCLRLLDHGYVNVFTPYAKLYHHESVSVGDPSKGERDRLEFMREIALMHKRWGDKLQKDPYYNKNLTLEHEDFSIKTGKIS